MGSAIRDVSDPQATGGKDGVEDISGSQVMSIVEDVSDPQEKIIQKDFSLGVRKRKSSFSGLRGKESLAKDGMPQTRSIDWRSEYIDAMDVMGDMDTKGMDSDFDGAPMRSMGLPTEEEEDIIITDTGGDVSPPIEEPTSEPTPETTDTGGDVSPPIGSEELEEEPTPMPETTDTGGDVSPPIGSEELEEEPTTEPTDELEVPAPPQDITEIVITPPTTYTPPSAGGGGGFVSGKKAAKKKKGAPKGIMGFFRENPLLAVALVAILGYVIFKMTGLIK